MLLVAPVCLFVCLFVCLSDLSCLSINTLTPEQFFYWRGVIDIGTWLCQVQQKVL